MRAVVISRPGPPGVLTVREVPVPEPGVGAVLVRVHAAGVNRADLLQRAGHYPAPPGVRPDVPGLEYAGVVEACGAGVTGWRAGDRVMGLVPGGGYAEYVVVDEREVVPVPASLALDVAAAVPEAFITAHDALCTQLDLKPGAVVLIHAAGSGVGTAAVQLARALGARTVGTQRSGWKLERARALGLDVAIRTTGPDFAAAVLEATAGQGAEVILDLVGGDYVNEDVRALAQRGRIMLVGLTAGARTELDLRALLNRRAALTGTVLRTRALEERIAVTAAFVRDVLPLLETGAVRPIVDRVLPLEQAAAAHELLEGNEVFGKVVLALV